MQLRNNLSLRWYFHLYHFVAKERLIKQDVDLRQVHSVLTITITTSFLMWSYTLVSAFNMNSNIPTIVGIICSLTHLLTPLLYRVSNKTFPIMNLLLTTGMVFQTVFAWYTGGMISFPLIWLGILPILAGVIYGLRGAITWFTLAITLSTFFLALHLIDFHFPNEISPEGVFWGQTILVYGWILLSSLMIVFYTAMREETEKQLHKRGHQIDDLFRVLFHDLAGPLGRISIGLAIAKKQMPPNQSNRGLELATEASDSMIEITKNIRNMYAASKGRSEIEMSFTSLNSTIEYLLKVFSAEMEEKNIRLEYDFEKNLKAQLFVEPISFNNQVMGNIFSNAIKFSRASGKIKISVQELDADNLLLKLSDTGIGISDETMKNIFDLRRTTTTTGTKGETGSGFGLYIMKSFVEMYGGKVAIESKSDGTTILMTLKGQYQ